MKMIVHDKRKKKKQGRGLLNNIINKLPVELHLPGYNYCGPGTKLKARLTRGDRPINQLDAACKEHDIAYSQNTNDMNARHTADRTLAEKAWQRVLSSDAKFGERAAAYSVTNAMKLKSKLGMGLKINSSGRVRKKKNKMTTFSSIVKKVSKSMVADKKKTPKNIISAALKVSRSVIKKAGGKNKIKIPRVLPVSSKIGGFLPLVPLFAGLSALGAVAGGTAGIFKTINDVKASKQQLEENKRHNKTMEAIALGKALNLRAHKQGYGLYLRSPKG